VTTFFAANRTTFRLISVLYAQSSSSKDRQEEKLMPQTDSFKPTRLFAGLAAGLMFAICTLQSSAQTAPGSRATRSFSVG